MAAVDSAQMASVGVAVVAAVYSAQRRYFARLQTSVRSSVLVVGWFKLVFNFKLRSHLFSTPLRHTSQPET